MGPLDLSGLREGALVLIDSAPLIYWLEDRAPFAARFAPVFEAHAAGRIAFAVTTVTLAEVLAGPLKAGDEALAQRYRAVLGSWRMVDLDADIADAAARLRARFGLKLPDAVQAASALALDADALVTHDRDFSRVAALRVLG